MSSQTHELYFWRSGMTYRKYFVQDKPQIAQISWISDMNEIGSLFVFRFWPSFCPFCHKIKCAHTHDSDFWRSGSTSGKYFVLGKSKIAKISWISNINESEVFLFFYNDFRRKFDVFFCRQTTHIHNILEGEHNDDTAHFIMFILLSINLSHGFRRVFVFELCCNGVMKTPYVILSWDRLKPLYSSLFSNFWRKRTTHNW